MRREKYLALAISCDWISYFDMGDEFIMWTVYESLKSVAALNN